MAQFLGGMTWMQLGKKTVHEAMDDNIFDQAAMMAFYFLLALFPLLIFLISILGFVISGSDLQTQLMHWITQAMPSSASGLVSSVVKQTTHGGSSGKLSFGILFALWTASSGMVAVIQGLNVAYDLKESRSWIRQRFTALWLTLAIGLFMLVAVAAILFGGWIENWLGSSTGMGDAAAMLWQILQWPLAVFLVMLAFAIVYRYAPNKPTPRWKWVTPGAIAGVLLWVLASVGFRIYLAHFNSYASTYGSLGGVIILILWFYITAIAILLGAEVDAEVEAAAQHKSDDSSSGAHRPAA